MPASATTVVNCHAISIKEVCCQKMVYIFSCDNYFVGACGVYLVNLLQFTGTSEKMNEKNSKELNSLKHSLLAAVLFNFVSLKFL